MNQPIPHSAPKPPNGTHIPPAPKPPVEHHEEEPMPANRVEQHERQKVETSPSPESKKFRPKNGKPPSSFEFFSDMSPRDQEATYLELLDDRKQKDLLEKRVAVLEKTKGMTLGELICVIGIAIVLVNQILQWVGIGTPKARVNESQIAAEVSKSLPTPEKIDSAAIAQATAKQTVDSIALKFQKGEITLPSPPTTVKETTTVTATAPHLSDEDLGRITTAVKEEVGKFAQANKPTAPLKLELTAEDASKLANQMAPYLAKDMLEKLFYGGVETGQGTVTGALTPDKNGDQELWIGVPKGRGKK